MTASRRRRWCATTGLLGSRPPAPSLRPCGASPPAARRPSTQVRAWADAQPERQLAPARVRHAGPAVPDPGAIYTVGHNYRAPGEAASRPDRPLIYGKAARRRSRATARRWPGTAALTDNVDAECELGVVIGRAATNVARRRPGPRLRLHDHRRRVVARRVARRRPVAARQVDAGVLPGRPMGRHARRAGPARPPPGLHDQRRADPARLDVVDAVRHREIVAYLSRHARPPARRPDRHRDAGPPRHAARPRPDASGRATPSPAGSRASGSSPPPSEHTRPAP